MTDPSLEYVCTACGHEYVHIDRSPCKSCKSEKVVKVRSAASLFGSGWRRAIKSIEKKDRVTSCIESEDE